MKAEMSPLPRYQNPFFSSYFFVQRRNADGSQRRALQADKEKQFEIRQGQKVGVTTR